MEVGAFTKATSVESEVGTVPLFSSHPREELKNRSSLDALTRPAPPTEPPCLSISPRVTLP